MKGHEPTITNILRSRADPTDKFIAQGKLRVQGGTSSFASPTKSIPLKPKKQPKMADWHKKPLLK